MLDKVAFIVSEFFPVLNILGKIYFLCSPEASHLILVHFPDVIVLDWQDHKSVRVLLKKGLRKTALSL